MTVNELSAYWMFFVVAIKKNLVLNSTCTIYMPEYTPSHFVVDDKLYPNASTQNDNATGI